MRGYLRVPQKKYSVHLQDQIIVIVFLFVVLIVQFLELINLEAVLGKTIPASPFPHAAPVLQIKLL